MKLDPKRLGVAVAGMIVILWIACSAMVALAPGPMVLVTGHMVSADLADFSWSLTWTGFAIGLLAWVVSAAVAAGLVAWTYNRLSGIGAS